MTVPQDVDRQAASLATPRPAERPRWVTVSGGKGGVGKTLVAVNLALLAQRAGWRTLLVDLDPGLGNVDVHLRVAPRFGLEHLLDDHEDTVEPRRVPAAAPGGIHVVRGASGSLRFAGGDGAFYDRVLAGVGRAASDFDLVVCDTGAGIGPSVVTALRHADVNLAVTTPDPAAVTDVYAVLKIAARLQLRARPGVVVNDVGDESQAMSVTTRLNEVARRFLGEEPCRLLGWVPTAPALRRSVAEQRPIGLAGARDEPVAAQLSAITATVLSELPRSWPSRTARETTRRVLRRLRPISVRNPH